MQKLAKKVILKYLSKTIKISVSRLKISQLAFYEHHNTSCVDASRTYQTALSAEHTFIHFEISPLILATPYKRMHLAEVELRKVSGRTGRCAGTATYASLQLRHFENNLVAFAQVVAVEVYRAGLVYRKTEIYHLLLSYFFSNHSFMRCATVVASFSVSPTLFGAVTVPA